MKKKVLNVSRRSLALTLALALVVGIVLMVPTLAADTSALGQLIDSFTANDYTFTLSSTSRFFLTEEPTEELKETVQLVQSQFDADNLPAADVQLAIVWGDASWVREGDILIKMVDSSDTTFGDEGYKLEVTSYATVTAKDVRGLMYGLNMLQKHFRNAGSNTIKGFTAIDTPDTKERVVSIDCARKYLTANYICNMIKEMSWMGYNTLQLHFSEDSGFRVDLWDESLYQDYNGDGVKYEPANDFTWLCGGHPTTWTHESALTGVDYADYDDKDLYLSMSDVIQILQTCKDYHIDVIPSFDTPAHLDYTTWKYEQNYKANNSYSFYSTYDETTYYAKDVSGCINYSNKTGYTVPQWPYYTTFNIAGAQANAFITELHIDIANFFYEFAGSTQFSICADECNMNYNTTWDYDDFIGYVKKLHTILGEKGYTIRMYNDFIDADYLSQIPSDIRILYWNSHYNSITGTANAYDVISVANMVANNRILYNCINQHTYYVLRINDTYGDARSATCYQWEFYGATEEAIFNDWTPNNIRKKGKYTEPDAIVSNENLLGGAYFLMWHDYAAVNTETEIWNGVTDSAKNTGEFYSLRNRMWSNSIKMWNWDINTDDFTFDDFKALRNTLGDFPGLQSDTYSDATRAAATSLPEPSEPIQLADHTELEAALESPKIEQGNYTLASYNAYLTAYNYALSLNADNSATAEEIGAALSALNAAIKNLTIKTNSFTVTLMTTINNNSYEIDSTTYAVPVSESTFNLFIPAMNGYEYIRVESSDEDVAATFTLSTSGDGSGYLSGPAVSDVTFTIWYENKVDISRLEDLVEEAIMEQGNFTHASWVNYTTVLSKARNFSLSATTTQDDVDALVKNLEDARTALIVDCDTTTITIEKVNNSFLSNGQIGLHIYTTPNVASLTVTNQSGTVQTLDYCSGEVQELLDGTVVKYWLVFFAPAEADIPEDVTTVDLTYTVSYRTASDEVTVTVAVSE